MNVQRGVPRLTYNSHASGCKGRRTVVSSFSTKARYIGRVLGSGPLREAITEAASCF